MSSNTINAFACRVAQQLEHQLETGEAPIVLIGGPLSGKSTSLRLLFKQTHYETKALLGSCSPSMRSRVYEAFDDAIATEPVETILADEWVTHQWFPKLMRFFGGRATSMVLTAHRPTRWEDPPWRSSAAPTGLVEVMVPKLDPGEKLEIFESVVAGHFKSKGSVEKVEKWLIRYGPSTIGEYVLFCRTLQALGSEDRKIDPRVLRKAARAYKSARDALIANRRLDPVAEFRVVGASSIITKRFRLED
jgi:hypothetical protein